MFAADLPVAEEAVLGGFRDQTERTQRLRELYVPHAETEPDPEFSEASSRALLAATRDVEANTDVVRMVRKLLKEAGRPTDDDELRMVLTALFGLLLGEPPEEHDVEALTALLEMIGGAGLMESIGEGVPPVLAGISDWHEVLTISTQDQSDVPADLSFSELVDARDLCVGLGTVFTAVPEDAAHYLGGRYIASLWQPENPQRIVQLLTWTVNARRANHIDEEPMFNAARAAGILPDS